jgi:hypothetical protein
MKEPTRKEIAKFTYKSRIHRIFKSDDYELKATANKPINVMKKVAFIVSYWFKTIFCKVLAMRPDFMCRFQFTKQ